MRVVAPAVVAVVVVDDASAVVAVVVVDASAAGEIVQIHSQQQPAVTRQIAAAAVAVALLD